MTLRDRLLPWSGLVLGTIGWAGSGQWDAMHVSDACLFAGKAETAGLGLAGLLLTLLGAWLSWRAARGARSPVANFVAWLSLLADALFALAILFHTAASLVIPRCFS
jgi:hypothetical protein